MAKAIPFQKLLAVMKEKLGIDATEELQKAWDEDLNALRAGIATKSTEDSRLDTVVADVAELKTMMASLTELMQKQQPTMIEAVKSNLVAQMPDGLTKFVTDQTASIAAVQTALTAVLEALAQMKVQQKSEPVFQGINVNKATEALIAAISATNQKADDATQSLFPNSSIKWNN